MNRVLIIGATGNVGRQVLSQLPATGLRVRALARNPQTAGLPPHVDVVRGDLTLPENPAGVVLFAHGSGSSRLSPRNQFVARRLNDAGLATLLIDLLTPDEERLDDYTRELRFNIALLAVRLAACADWLGSNPSTTHLPLGLFGAGREDGAGGAGGELGAEGGPSLEAAGKRPKVFPKEVGGEPVGVLTLALGRRGPRSPARPPRAGSSAGRRGGGGPARTDRRGPPGAAS